MALIGPKVVLDALEKVRLIRKTLEMAQIRQKLYLGREIFICSKPRTRQDLGKGKLLLL